MLKFIRRPLLALGIAASLGVAGLAASQSTEGMGKPNLAANWGSSTEKAIRLSLIHI